MSSQASLPAPSHLKCVNPVRFQVDQADAMYEVIQNASFKMDHGPLPCPIHPIAQHVLDETAIASQQDIDRALWDTRATVHIYTDASYKYDREYDDLAAYAAA
eukprot:9296005-Karenia_brevis.AAC.1